MRKSGRYLFFVLSIILGCSDDSDEGPTDPVPVIEYRNLVFHRGRSVYYADTLELTIHFADGDMDLGLDANEISAPYHYTNYFLAGGNGDTIKVETEQEWKNLNPVLKVKKGETSDLITHRTRIKPGYDFLPPYEPPYSCLNYRFDSVFVSVEDTAVFNRKEVYIDRILKNTGMPDIYVLRDTFYYEINPHATNMDVDILVEGNAGTFEVFELPINMTNCLPYNNFFSNRFPRLDDLRPGKQYGNGAYTISGTSPRQGDMLYKITSIGLRPFFGGKRIKVRVSIEDRALHASNTIETDAIEIPSN